MAKYLDENGLVYLWSQIKSYFSPTQTPKMDGTAAMGTSSKYAREDHVHPADTNKVDKVSGKGLSTNDYTTTEKNKLAGIAAGAEVNVQSDWSVTDSTSDAFIKNKPTIPAAVTVDTALNSTSTNPVQNKVINTALGNKVEKVTGKGLSTNDYTTDEKTKLSGIAAGAEVNVQSDWSVTDSSSDAFIKNKPTIPSLQNVFGIVKVGSTSIEADTTRDTLTLAAGSNVTLTPDATNDKVTIAATDTTYGVYTAPAGQSAGAAGLVPAPIPDDWNKILTAGGYWQELYVTHTEGSTTQLLGQAIDDGHGMLELDIDTADYSTPGFMSSADKTKLDGIASGATANTGTVTSVRVQATSPVQSSQSTAQTGTLNTTISLADGYGDTKNPYASKTKNYVLAAPSSAAGAPTFRALVDADIPSGIARLAGPTFSGTPKAPTAAAGTNTTQIATTAFVTTAIANAQTGAATYKGAATAEADISGTAYKAGWYWVVSTAGTYFGQLCEVGDMIFANSDKGSAAQSSDFDIIQANITTITNAEIDAIIV